MTLADLTAKTNQEIVFHRPLTPDEVAAAEKDLGVSFPAQLSDFLRQFGSIRVGSLEFWGLGVPEDSHVHLAVRTKELWKLGLDHNHVGIIDLDDLHYAICDCAQGGVWEWAPSTAGGRKSRLAPSLDDFVLSMVEDMSRQ